MSDEKVPARQLGAWLCAALIPVLIQNLSGTSWTVVGITGVICGLATWLVWKFGGEVRWRWAALAEFFYIIIVLGELLPDAAGSWTGNSFPAVPLMLLALAAWSVQKGVSAAARVGCVLFWFVLIMYLAVFGAGVKEVKLKWLLPTWELPDWKGVLMLLVPAAAAQLLRKEEKWKPRLVLPAAFVIVASALAAGVLSAGVAGKMENAFYELSRSLNLFGVAKRFEAVISAGMTVGWFALLSLLLSLGRSFFETVKPGWGKAGLWVTAAGGAVWMLCGLHMGERLLVILSTVFWVLVPILAQGLEKQKKT